MKNMSGEILIQVSGFFKDINIHMLSDDDFSEVWLILLLCLKCYLAKTMEFDAKS